MHFTVFIHKMYAHLISISLCSPPPEGEATGEDTSAYQALQQDCSS